MTGRVFILLSCGWLACATGAQDRPVAPAEGSPSPALPTATAATDSLAKDPVEAVPPRRVVHRIGHLAVNAPETVQPGKKLKVTVSVERGTLKEDPDSGVQSKVADAEDVSPAPYVVYLLASQQLRVEGSGYQTIALKQNEALSESAQFSVIVERQSRQDGLPAYLTALVFHRGYPCGRLRKKLTVGSPGGDKAPAAETMEAFSPLTHAPDGPELVVTVVQTDSKPVRFQYFVQASNCKEPNGSVESWDVPANADEELRTKFARFSSTTGPHQSPDGLVKNGEKLYNKAPDKFKAALKELSVLRKFPRTILVFSDEPHVPWELMVPRDSREGKRKPLGVSCSMGRWCASDPHELLRSPERKIRLRTAIVWAPQYGSNLELAKSATERDFVVGNLHGGMVEPATFENLRTELSKTAADLLHLICHGSSDGDQEGEQTISGIADDGSEGTISVSELAGDEEFQKFCARRPLIFLNACEVGGTIQTMTGVGGFAPAFLELNAGAVIAPLWSVNDEVALATAKEFYTTLQQNPTMPLAEVLRRVRAHAYEENPVPHAATYAAYSFYGDPLAVIEPPSPPDSSTDIPDKP